MFNINKMWKDTKIVGEAEKTTNLVNCRAQLHT